MTVKKFIELMQGYYSLTYSEIAGPIIARYLTGWTEKELEQLAAIVIKSHSGQFGKLPDVATFEKLKPQVYNAIKYLPGPPAIEDKSELATTEEIDALFKHLENTIFRKVTT
jgi:hypothetical protein